MSFVCSECREVVPSRYDQFRVRLEVVRLDGKERPYVRTLRLVGRCCLDRIAGMDEAEQGRLL